MPETEFERELREIRSLRSQGLITPKQAYDRHLALLDAQAMPAVGRAEASAPAPPAPSFELRLGWDVLAVSVALLGGVLGTLGAFVQELRSSGILLAFIGAPVIEEALKPAGVYLLLARWPQVLRGRLHTAVLTALAGLSFGLIESLVYLYVYYPHHGAALTLYRFTVTPLVHTIASFTVGLGLNRGLIDWAGGRARLPLRTRNFYLAAVGLHALYNTSTIVLELTHVLNVR